MKTLSLSLFVSLLAFVGASNAQAMDVPAGETDITTLEWVDNGQPCTKDFNNPDGGTVFGTDANGVSVSYVDVSNYGVIKLYGEAGQQARLFINRAELGDNGIFFVDIDSEGVGTFDCNEVLKKQPLAQHIYLNGAKASAWNTHLNLSLITVSGDPVQFVEDTFELVEGEIEIQDLIWVNQGQGCANNFGADTDATIYGTDAGPNGDQLSYVDVTPYASIKLYGNPGDKVRLFINRAEYPDNFQFYVTIDEDGVGTFDLANVYTTQEGAEYVHLNGLKNVPTWSGGTGKAKVNHITVVEKPFEVPEGEIDITTLETVGTGENNIGKTMNGGFVIYGDQNNGDNFHVDVTNFANVKIYGTTGALVRIFVNREGAGDVHEQKVKIEDGVGELNIKAVMEALEADKVWISCFKNAAGWQGGTDDNVKIYAITVQIDLEAIEAAYLADEAQMNAVVNAVAKYNSDVDNEFPGFAVVKADEFAALTTMVNGLQEALTDAAVQAMETGNYVSIAPQITAVEAALAALIAEQETLLAEINEAYEEDEAQMNEVITSYQEFIADVDENFPAYAEKNADEFANVTTLVNGLQDALATAMENAFETGEYVDITAQILEATEALMSLSAAETAAYDAIDAAAEADYDKLMALNDKLSPIIDDEDDKYDLDIFMEAGNFMGQVYSLLDDVRAAQATALTETAEYVSPLNDEELAALEAQIDAFLETAGIAAIGSDNVNAKYYDLNGREVKNPAKGQMIIKVANGTATKVAL